MRKAPRKHSHLSPEPPIRPSIQKIRGDIQDQIAAMPAVKSCLRVLEARGLHKERLLKYTATLVLLDKAEGWRRDKRTKRNPHIWRSLAKQLRRAAEDLEHTCGTGSTRPDGLALSLGLAFIESVPRLTDPRKTVASMRKIAADLRDRAALSGQIRKRVIPWIRRRPEVALLQYACKPIPWSASELSPKDRRELFQRLAELLDTAYEAYGIKPRFSADSLEKTFKRHVLPSFPSS